MFVWYIMCGIDGVKMSKDDDSQYKSFEVPFCDNPSIDRRRFDKWRAESKKRFIDQMTESMPDDVVNAACGLEIKH